MHICRTKLINASQFQSHAKSQPCSYQRPTSPVLTRCYPFSSKVTSNPPLFFLHHHNFPLNQIILIHTHSPILKNPLLIPFLFPVSLHSYFPQKVKLLRFYTCCLQFLSFPFLSGLHSEEYLTSIIPTELLLSRSLMICMLPDPMSNFHSLFYLA